MYGCVWCVCIVCVCMVCVWCDVCVWYGVYACIWVVGESILSLRLYTYFDFTLPLEDMKLYFIVVVCGVFVGGTIG